LKYVNQIIILNFEKQMSVEDKKKEEPKKSNAKDLLAQEELVSTNV
jgi:hypothetical protein